MFKDTTNLKDKEIILKVTRTADAMPEKEYLPAYYFDICLLNGEKIGSCDLRIGHNNKTYIGGNIGYNIDLEHRGKNYATKACFLLFKLAKDHGLDHLYITCQPNNVASYKTCEKSGCSFIEIAEIPENYEMYAEGKRQVKIYEKTL